MQNAPSIKREAWNETSSPAKLAGLTVNLFPFLMALIAIFICVLAVRLVPWMGQPPWG